MATLPHSLRVSLLPLLLATTLCAEPRYTLDDLGLAVSNSVNAAGIAAGTTFRTSHEAVRLQAGSAPQPLGFLGTGMVSTGYGIGDSGAIVGASDTAASGATSQAFVWTILQGMQPLMEPPGTTAGSIATAINPVNTITGVASAGSTSYPIVWIGLQPSSLGTLGGPHGTAQAINGAGDIAGDTDTTLGAVHATFWPIEGGIFDLQTLPEAIGSQANAINLGREIVGQVFFPVNNFGYRWTPTTGMQLLSLVPGDTGARPLGINTPGQIVGTGQPPMPFPGADFPHAIVWASGTAIPENLNTLVDAPTWRLLSGNSINDAGQIVCDGLLTDGTFHAVLLTPIVPRSPVATVPLPEPQPPPTTPPPTTPPPPTPTPAPPVVAQPVPGSPPPTTPPQPPSQEPPPVASQPPPQSPPPTTTPVMASTSGGSGGGCTLAPGAGGDPVLVSLCGIMMLHLAWKRGRRSLLLKSRNLVQN